MYEKPWLMLQQYPNIYVSPLLKPISITNQTDRHSNQYLHLHNVCCC